MILSLGQLATDGTATTGVPWSIITGATPGRARILEIGLFLSTVGTSPNTIGLGRPAANGVTPTTPVDFQVEDPADVLATGVLQACLAWGTKPTAPTQYFRRIGLPATVGTGVIWTFPKGIVMAVSSNLVLYNASGNAVGLPNCYAVADM
jgi:hypothetical protein